MTECVFESPKLSLFLNQILYNFLLFISILWLMSNTGQSTSSNAQAGNEQEESLRLGVTELFAIEKRQRPNRDAQRNGGMLMLDSICFYNYWDNIFKFRWFRRFASPEIGNVEARGGHITLIADKIAFYSKDTSSWTEEIANHL